MEKKGEGKKKELPVKEIKYSQTMEEMNQLIPFLREQMSPCPNEDLIFIVIETIDYYNLVRNFKIKSKTGKNDSSLKCFKDKLFSNISSLESFTVTSTLNDFEIDAKSNKGNKFKLPKIYNFNAEEINLDNNDKEIFLFVYDNFDDLFLFISNNKNSNIPIFCLGINMQFFEAKKKIKNSGLLNNQLFNFCFTDISKKGTNLIVNNLPRIIIFGPGGIDRKSVV